MGELFSNALHDAGVDNLIEVFNMKVGTYLNNMDRLLFLADNTDPRGDWEPRYLVEVNQHN